MITNVIKNQNGTTVQWTDTTDNRTTKIENYLHRHYCKDCGTPEKDMQFISETGYYTRTVKMRCKCGNIVTIYG